MPRGTIDLRMKAEWTKAGAARGWWLAGVAAVLGLSGISGQAQTSTSSSTSSTTNTTLQPTATGRQKLAAAQIADYRNKYEIYGGINFMNGQAGQTLPKRYNLGGAEGMFTYWMTKKLGVAGDYRWDGGTTPVLSPYYNRVLVKQSIGMGGVQYRGPKGRYAAIDYHALAGVTSGTFDHAIQNYPGGSPVSATDIGLYTNRTSFMAALGGSVDFNYTRNIAIRLQPDLILEHFGTEVREFVSVSGGVVYRFGRR
ncbi:MAG: hypothetical protein ABI209_04650, partial [Edaphobacter sp.]